MAGDLKVLVVDDQQAVCTALELLFEVHGLPTIVANTPEQALRAVTTEDVGVVVQDMNFRRDATSGAEGVELLRAIKKLDPELPVLIITAFTSLEAAVQLVKEGASDYLAKPWNDDKLVTSVKNLVRLRELAQENLRLESQRTRARSELSAKFDVRGLVFASAAMQDVVSLAVRVAPSDAPVLITGPNGSGKERLAEIIQANSRRRAAPFVRVNAGGLPDQLLEAELFGAEAGAFTGATKTRIGRFEEANGGTLFLDEIGNLSVAGQMKLLRVLQTGEYQRLGSNVTRKADVRLISATNANLPKMIAEGTFREDLYFRINVIELPIPPLRNRAEDALLLAEHFLAAQGGSLSFSDDARRAILEHDWPGNVRELENRVRRATLVHAGRVVTREELGLGARPASGVPAQPSPSAPSAAEPPDAERAEIERALSDARGVVSRAAAMLGLSRQALYRKMDRLGLEMTRSVKG